MYSLPVLQQMMKKIAKQYAGSGGGGGNDPQTAYGAIDVQLNVQLIKNAFRDAEASQKSRYQDGNMVVDVFTDLSGIDILQSTNVSLVDGTITQLDMDVAPHNMTSNNTPEPYVALASSALTATYAPYRAFDGDYKGGIAWVMAPNSGFIQLDFGEGHEKQIEKYNIVAWNVSNHINTQPKDWSFEGSVDGENWTLLDVRTGETNWAQGEKRSYRLQNKNFYRFYRLNITDNNGSTSYTAIQELEFYQIGQGEIEFPTKVINTVRVPKRLIIVAELTGTARFDVSLDNGVSWLGDVSANALIDVSMLSGTELIIRVTLSNPGTLYSLGYIWYDDVLTPMNMRQTTRLNVSASVDIPYILEIPIAQTLDFLVFPPSVLKFIPDQDDLARTLCDFQQSDQSDFEPSPYISYDNGMYLKSMSEESFIHVADTNYYECEIDMSVYANIETILLAGGE